MARAIDSQEFRNVFGCDKHPRHNGRLANPASTCWAFDRLPAILAGGVRPTALPLTIGRISYGQKTEGDWS
jgi:hypothetical protein